jgi:hypothetical protein
MVSLPQKKCYPKGGSMTRGSIREYTEAVRGRYLPTSKKEKGKILDEFTKVIGCHCKAAKRVVASSDEDRRVGVGSDKGRSELQAIPALRT